MPAVYPSSVAARSRGRTAALRAFVLGLALVAMPVAAGAQVTIAYKSDYRLTLDDNKSCPDGKGVRVGPHAQYIHFRVTNNGPDSLRAPSAVLSLPDNVIRLGGTQAPGNGVQAAQIYFAPLAANQSWDGFWYLEFDCGVDNKGVGATRTATVRVYDGATLKGTATQALTTYGMNGTGTGGSIVQQSITAVTLGALTYLTVGYEFGNVGANTVFNISPAGTEDFNAKCFQLVGNEVIGGNVDAIPIGTKNQLHFSTAVSQSAPRYTATVKYTFRAMCAGVTTTAKPFANQLSGGNLKYSSNFDVWGKGGETGVPPVANPFTITKGASPDTLSDGGLVTYTVTITNTSASESMIDSIADVLPNGAVYAGLHTTSQVQRQNSLSVPDSNATGRIVWRAVPGVYYKVPAGASLTLAYRAIIPPPEGTYVNRVTAIVGVDSTNRTTKNVVVRRIADVSVTKTGPKTARMDDTVRFVLTVGNAGPSAARTVTLTDTLPAVLQFVRATRGGTFASGVVTWPAIDSMPPGTTVKDTVVAVVLSAGTATNIAATRSPRLDPTLANNNGSDSTSRVTLTLSLPFIAVAVAPKDSTPIKRLAGTAYAVPFTVTNESGHAESFDILFRRGQLSSAVTRDSITATGVATPPADSLRLALPDSTPRTVNVWYTVAFGDTAAEHFTLTARAVRNPVVRDSGLAVIRRSAPALTIAKSVTADGAVAPGVELTYTSTFQNAGDFAARGAAVDEALPPEVMLKVGSVVPSLPTGISGGIEYSADDGSSWSYVPAPGACGAPAGYDGCVTRVRLVLANDLAPAAGGTLVYVARVR